MKILVCYAYADLNKGDSAICLGMKDYLKDSYPNADLHFLNFSYSSSYCGSITKNYYESLHYTIIDRVGENNKFSIISNLLFKWDKRRIKKIIKDGMYDLVLMNGGHFIYSTLEKSLKARIKNLMRLNHVFNPMYCAKELGIKTGIIGQSVGPINKDAKCLDIIRKADFIYTREKKSSKEINSYFETPKAIPYIDLAFYMKLKFKMPEQKKTKSIAINLRKVVASGGLELNRKDYFKQFDAIKEFIKYILENTNETICLFSQVKGYEVGSAENDEDIHVEFKEKYFHEEGRLLIKHLDDSQENIINYYKNECSLLISTRFHGLIFSLLAGVPSIGFNVPGVGNKIVGLYQDLDITEYIYDGNNDFINIYKRIPTFPSPDIILDRIDVIKKKQIADFVSSI